MKSLKTKLPFYFSLWFMYFTSSQILLILCMSWDKKVLFCLQIYLFLREPLVKMNIFPSIFYINGNYIPFFYFLIVSTINFSCMCKYVSRFNLLDWSMLILVTVSYFINHCSPVNLLNVFFFSKLLWLIWKLYISIKYLESACKFL